MACFGGKAKEDVIIISFRQIGLTTSVKKQDN